MSGLATAALLKSATVGVFTPWQLADGTNLGLFLKDLVLHRLPVPLSGDLTSVYFLEAQKAAAISPQKLSAISPALRGGWEAGSSPYPF